MSPTMLSASLISIADAQFEQADGKWDAIWDLSHMDLRVVARVLASRRTAASAISSASVAPALPLPVFRWRR
jgi:hypothetical protein